jgi:glycyl-tRNA synthetase
LSSPAQYFETLAEQGIILDPEVRKAAVEEQINAIAFEAGGEIHPDPDLLTEVTHLVEAPTALRGDFNPRHLELPREVLIAVMKKHQRYFPIHKGDELLPHFVIVANKPAGTTLEAIKLGNEDVVRARFADAAYFVKEDLKRPLEDFIPELEKLTFQADLGSMLDKTQRIGHLVGVLAPMFDLTSEETYTAARAAKLCKADLATQMVVEMTSLQGVIGRDYALAAGEPPVIANAIFEHYLPRSAGDAVPKGKAGLVVGIVDRLDSLAGLFAAGLAPTGNKDPFAQRRAALGLVGNLIHWQLDFDLRPALEAAAENLPIEASLESQAECLNFIIERLRNVLLDEGYRYDIVDAVVTGQGYNPAKAAQAAQELTDWVAREDWDTILPAYSRCVRITRPLDETFEVAPTAFTEPAAIALFAALEQAEASEREPGSIDDFLNAFVPMIPAVDKFFDDVLVMDDDRSIRENRLGLLQRIASLVDGVADMSKLEGF